MSFSLHGVHVPHRKNTADKPAVRLTEIKSVTIPTSMHIVAPAKPTVKVGDAVRVGQMIAEGIGFVSSPIHASVSGKVTKISDILLSSGATVPAITIESDGEMTVCESVEPPNVSSREELIDAIRSSGAVGLGGAGFPTHVKWSVEPDRIQEFIINGAECEPYITSDSYTMTERADDMEIFIRAVQKHFGVKRTVIGIESNKRNAIRSMQRMAERMEGVEVKVLPRLYPQGGEKVLVYHTAKKVITTGKLPIDVGCIVCNCTTVAAIGSYLKTGMPLVKKCVTVDGGSIKTPQNVIAPIGASIKDVIDLCGGFTVQPQKVLYGGPMMGITVPDLSLPIIKNTNAIIALSAKEAELPKTTACIRCGACTNACPFGLAPAQILRAYNKNDTDALRRLSVDTCMLCGCCSFICPANRPLVQTNSLSKQLLREEKAKEASKNG
ncbi:MAG: electron transport complex subunit RsxC [Ruminococcaceae bacterium]|nr:electron transport complex subunit RsxC [Oscillospiraceae bacterium]